MEALSKLVGAAALVCCMTGSGLAAENARLDDSGAATDRYLQADEILAVMHGANEPFFQCFRAHAGTSPPGEVAVSFLINRRGEALRPQVDARDDLAALSACISEAAVALRFPTHDGAPLEVAYPLVFRSDLEFGTALLDYPLVFVRNPPRHFSILHLPAGLSEAEQRLLEVLLWQPLQDAVAT